MSLLCQAHVTSSSHFSMSKTEQSTRRWYQPAVTLRYCVCLLFHWSHLHCEFLEKVFSWSLGHTVCMCSTWWLHHWSAASRARLLLAEVCCTAATWCLWYDVYISSLKLGLFTKLNARTLRNEAVRTITLIKQMNGECTKVLLLWNRKCCKYLGLWHIWQTNIETPVKDHFHCFAFNCSWHMEKVGETRAQACLTQAVWPL